MLLLRNIAMSILAGHLLLGWCFSAVAQQPKPPTVSYVQPLGIPPGGETEVLLTGERLAGSGNVWLSSASSAILPATGPSDSVAKSLLKLPADTPLGLLGIRYFNPTGVSNLRLLLVDDLKSVPLAGRPRSLPAAMPIMLPIAVEGNCEPESACYFKFTAAADQRVSLEVFARRLASPLDPILRVLDGNGQELAYRDDEPGLMGDCRMSFRAPVAGEYIVELRDVRYAGGPDYRYRLRIGTFPLTSVVFPPVVKRGGSAEVVACVTEGEPVPAMLVAIPAGYSNQHRQFGIKSSSSANGGSALVQVLTSDLEQSIEREPNDTAEQASEVVLPHGISGRFQQARDSDWYTLSAQGGEFLNVQVSAQSFGSPAEVSMKLFAADGNLLAETNPSLNDEAELNVLLPATGGYRLLVEELHRRGGEAFVYNLALQTKTPHYSLIVDRDRVSPPQQGVCTARVSIVRTRPTEPVTLSLRHGPPGALISDNVIAADKNETLLKIRLPADFPAGTLFMPEIVGTSQQEGQTVEVVAQSSAALQQELRWLSNAPSDFTRQLALGIGPAFPAFLKLTLEPAECVLPRFVGTASWVVKAERLHNFSDAVAIELKGLPPGVTVTGITIDKGRNDTTIMLAGGERLPEGTTPVELIAEAVLQDQPQSIRLAGTLRVIPPLRVSLAMAGTLPQEGKQKLTITIERFGKENNPVAVKLQNLPEGVNAPAEVVVPAGVNTQEIELSAALTAAVGKIDKLAAQAITKFQEQDVMAISPMVELEIVDGK